MATENKKKNRLKRTASSYKQQQLDDLNLIAAEQTEAQGRPVSVAELLRDGADVIIAKYKKDA